MRLGVMGDGPPGAAYPQQVRQVASGADGSGNKPQETPGTPQAPSLAEVDAVPEVPRPLYKVLSRGNVEKGRAWPSQTPSGWIKTASGTPTILLVHDPLMYWHPGSVVYLAEISPDAVTQEVEEGVLATCIRLTDAVDWSDLNVILSGERVVTEGTWLALGDSKVEITGGTLIARENCRFTARNDARVFCRDLAAGTAFDRSRVGGRESVRVHHQDESRGYYRDITIDVVGFGRSRISVWDSKVVVVEQAQAYLYDSYCVAKGDSRVNLIGGRNGVMLSDKATVHQGPFADKADVTRGEPEDVEIA